MLIDQADFLWEMDKLFVREFMGLTAPVEFQKGGLVFRESDLADYFFTLIEGRVRLTVGVPPREVYTVDRPGEAFGWSSLVDRNYYSAAAECMETTRCLKLEGRKLQTLLQNHPESGLLFYKKLAGMLGHRLVQFYQMTCPTGG